MIKSRRLRWAVYIVRIGERMNAYRLLVEKPEGKKSLGRPGHMQVDTIKLDSREIGWGAMDWTDLALDMDQWRALVNTVMKILVP
jgi:hypothetical protein